MNDLKRRSFIKLSGLTALPALISPVTSVAKSVSDHATQPKPVSFADDGPHYDPPAYISKLTEINASKTIETDFYGKGGAITRLEQQFAQATGKEAAIYMPTGTMANQLAIDVLSGENTKVFVQETSHIYRDEADAAQSIFGKRLIPVAQGQAYFTVEQLQEAISYHDKGEVFKSGIGVVAIENPVRRSDGRQIPIEEIKKIAAYCRANKYKLHLDGARLYLASAFSGISIAEYASYFDTVYISLYKYLGAGGGAILCGEKPVIAKMEHLIKVHGGTVFNNWSNAAMALYHLDGLDERLKRTAMQAQDLFKRLNKLSQLKINPLVNGSNVFHGKLGSGINGQKFSQSLREKQIYLRRPNNEGIIMIQVNETLLNMKNDEIEAHFKTALQNASE